MHKVGTVRYNLDGTNAGTVTEKDQAKRDKQMQQIKEYQSGQKSNDKKAGSTNQD
jgi:sRNA-binding protein